MSVADKRSTAGTPKATENANFAVHHSLLDDGSDDGDDDGNGDGDDDGDSDVMVAM